MRRPSEQVWVQANPDLTAGWKSAGFSASESFRGWLCNQCRSDLSIYTYGDDDGSEYMFVRVRRESTYPISTPDVSRSRPSQSQ